MATKIKVIKGRKTRKRPGKSVEAKKAAKPAKKKADKITKDILMGELVSKYPQTSEVLMNYGLHCIGCMLSPYESLEAGVSVHGIPLKPLLKDLNKVINK